MVPLVILDLNGVLIHKYHISEDKPTSSLYQREKLNQDIILIRKDLSDFLERLFSKYRIGIYTSTTRKKAEKILDMVLTPSQQEELVFFLSREHTLKDPDGARDYSTIKSIEYVAIRYHIPLDQILIVDDDASKIKHISNNYKIVVDKKALDEPEYFDSLSEQIQKMIFKNSPQKS